jgi:hypothetical protein
MQIDQHPNDELLVEYLLDPNWMLKGTTYWQITPCGSFDCSKEFQKQSLDFYL